MVERSHRFILGQLVAMKKDDPDRDILQNVEGRLRNRLKRKEEEANQSAMERENLSVAQARARLQEIVQQDESLHGGISEQLRKSNLEIQEESPDDSVWRLLPPEYRRFSATMNVLMRNKIETKDQLMALPKSTKKRPGENAWGFRKGLGVAAIPVILAMRNLAIAESRERSPGIS